MRRTCAALQCGTERGTEERSTRNRGPVVEQNDYLQSEEKSNEGRRRKSKRRRLRWSIKLRWHCARDERAEGQGSRLESAGRQA